MKGSSAGAPCGPGPKPRPGAQIFVPTKIMEEQPSNLPSVLATVAQIVGVLTTVIIVASHN